jgi:hypothetical protein
MQDWGLGIGVSVGNQNVLACADYIAKRMGECELISEAIRALTLKRLNAQQRLVAELRSIDGELEAVYQKCGHPFTKHHGDPSGGSDSWTECLVCGKQW